MIYFNFEFNCDVGTKEAHYIHSFCEDIEYYAKDNKMLGRMKEYQVRILINNKALIKYVQPLKEKCSRIVIQRTSQEIMGEYDKVYEFDPKLN